MKKILLLILILSFSNASASEFSTNFTKEKFEKAQKEGITVVVYSWNKFCSTCAKQKPILLQAKKDFQNVLFLDFEHTKNKSIAKYLNIDFWSTIVVYKNNNEINKGIGLYNKNDIYSLINEGT